MADSINKSKKRKKDTDDPSRPSKKVAIEEDRKIKISLRKEDQWAPIIASTPGVSLPLSIALKPYIKPRTNVENKPYGPLATTQVLLHSNDHPKLEYKAVEQEIEGGPHALLKHYLGVYDPSTGKLEVMEARKMVLRGVVRAHKATTEKERLSQKEQRDDLRREFGTKKSKKALAAITENAISQGIDTGKMDKVTQAMIAAMSKDAEALATRDELAAEAEAGKPRPKANLTATDIKDVYTINNLIGTDILKAVPILEWQQVLKEGKEIVVNSRYVAGRIQKVSSVPDKLKILRYMLLLIEIYQGLKRNKHGKMLPRREQMKEIAGGMPEPVIENARRHFSTDGAVSKFQVDLLSTHICALACLVDNYTVEMYDLQSDLRLETRGMSQYFKEIGAKISALPEARRKELGLDKATATQRKIAKLNLPLEFPKVPFARGPRRG